ncbi:uncharacterized protein BKCO1_1100087 [Diplodia corticola]|uniref:Uncharacterized protein n=1 Tax=Diplodia corticola TaxID=236234 RepID=A0A1J9S7Q9_9PEZI|nr:uncharacterized protein BKCO1_1100087 [Diplodia corticola]OJD36527.1 hypothetical protein BKCO1_1100087 [Diplodia corticola]
MPWDPDKAPGPSRLKRTAQPPVPLNLGPPVRTLKSIVENSTKAIAPDGTKINPVPFLLSYKDVQLCSAEFRHSPSTTDEAYAIASTSNIRHCVCPVCAPLIAAQVVFYYARRRYRTDCEAAMQKYTFEYDRLNQTLQQAKHTLDVVTADVRMKQAVFYRNLTLQEKNSSGSGNENDTSQRQGVRWNEVTCGTGDHLPHSLQNDERKQYHHEHMKGSIGCSSKTHVPLPSAPCGHTPSHPLDTSGYGIAFCDFYHRDQETGEKDEQCDCKEHKDALGLDAVTDELTPLPPQPAAPIAAALLIAALTFSTPGPLDIKDDSGLQGYLDVYQCLHNLPKDPSIPCAHINEFVTAYSPDAHMCLPCARLVSARRALFAAKQAMYEVEQSNVTGTELEVESVFTTRKQAEQLVQWREEAHDAMTAVARADHFVCNEIESFIVFGKE